MPASHLLSVCMCTCVYSQIVSRCYNLGRDGWDGWDELPGLRGIVEPPGLKGDTGAPGTKGDEAVGVAYVCRGLDSFPHN